MSSGTGQRAEVAGARRVVVKAGSSSLTTPDGRIDTARVHRLVDVVARHVGLGRQIVLVSSGAIAAGLGPLGLSGRPRDLATQQAAASVGQGVLVAAYAARFDGFDLAVGQVLLTADDFGRRVHYRNAQQTLNRLLELGVVPVVNENDTVATDEIRFGDNDRLAALVAHIVHAEALILLSDVDALFDGPPSRPGATVISEVVNTDDLVNIDLGGVGSDVGRGGMRTKVQAARIATSAGMHVVLTSADLAEQALSGDPVGTHFHPTGLRRPSRLLWLEHASEPRGWLVLDDGAVTAVVERGASLLPAGVVEVGSDFVAGDPVELRDRSGEVVAHGLVNYDASELPRLLGRSTQALAAELGPAYERELVHRDDLVLIRVPAR